MMTSIADAVINTTNLTHFYGPFRAVHNVNLQVQQGEIFGFLGPNGAGKTTTIRTILDFIRPTSGSVRVFGLDARRDAIAIRARIGYLPSELKLWDNWHGRDYVQWLEQMRGQPVVAEANRMAELLDFDLNRSLKGMSTGMKRKMGLIAALAHKPELLILDEPTSGLDPLMQQVFYRLMREARDEGRTVFLSSHQLPEVEQICDRVGIIRDGELREVNTVAQLTKVTFRWLTLTLPIDAPIADLSNQFAAVTGVSDFSADAPTIHMRVSGEADMQRVIQLAAEHDAVDVHIEKPTLEEIFLAYYGEAFDQ